MSDLVKRFPMLGDCNREVNGVCRNRSCLVRGGWVKGQKGGVRPSCSDLYEYAPHVAHGGACPECKAPIKFTEAK